MDLYNQMQNWRGKLLKLQQGPDFPLELGVPIAQTIEAVQAASALFSESILVLGRTRKGILTHKEAFQDLMCIEAQRNALWQVLSSLTVLEEAATGIDEEWFPADALDFLWEIRLEMTDLFDKMGEVDDVWIQRKAFNDAIRPYARPLVIHDIPIELWTLIFEQVSENEEDVDPAWLFPDYVEGSRSHIKNIRLTCHLFCDASSRFLFRRVDVALNPGSLARLDKISRHKIFSTSVLAVRIDLSCYAYNDRFTRDEGAFVSGAMEEVCRWMHIDMETLQLTDHGRNFISSQFGLSEEELADAVDKVGRAVVFWEAYMDFGGKSPRLDDTHEDVQAYAETSAAVIGMRECHREYQKRFDEQVDRHVNGSCLARSVAESMARMPKAVRLSMTDKLTCAKSCKFHESVSGKPNADVMKDLNLLIRERMLKPSTTWDEVVDCHWGPPPPGHLLHLLPVALHRAGVPLLHLDINISWNRRTMWELGDSAISDLGGLAKTLNSFNYNGPPDFPHIGASSICKYLSTLTSGENLENLCISFQLDQAETMSIGKVLTSLSPSASLRSVTLRHCSFDLDQLQSMLRKCGHNDKTLIALHGVQLQSGTWADALDALRDTVADRTSTVWVERPTGAECDGMSRERYNSIFASGFNQDYKYSKANQYIWHWSYSRDLHNPLRLPEPVEIAPCPAGNVADAAA